jgi:hypothetical protein
MPPRAELDPTDGSCCGETLATSSGFSARSAIAANIRLIIASPVRLVREGLAGSLRGSDGVAVVDAVNLSSMLVGRRRDGPPCSSPHVPTAPRRACTEWSQRCTASRMSRPNRILAAIASMRRTRGTIQGNGFADVQRH